MITKRITPSVWFKDCPTATLLDVHGQGPDAAQIQKIAASDFIQAADIRPEPGYSFVHLITTGAQEFYGPNNNADGFNEKAAEFEAPAYWRTGKPHTIQLRDGLSGFHNTFMKYGSVYREHNNSKKGGRPQGDIVLEAYNPRMHRGELVVKLNNDKWASEIQKLATGDPVFWSMGCGVPYDICTMCLKQAATKRDYCDHIKYRKLEMTKEGRQIYVINDQPHFHDISRVSVPADRIAFALAKVAGELSVDELETPPMWLPLSVIEKVGSNRELVYAGILNKLAEHEKRILAQGLSPDESNIADAFGSHLDDETIKELDKYPVGDTLSALKEKNVMLPPDAFVRIVLKRPQSANTDSAGICECLRNVFSSMQSQGDSDAISDASYTPHDSQHWQGLDDKAESLKEQFSVEDEPVSRRIVVIAIKGKPGHSKRAMNLVESTVNAESEILAREYAKYQISFLAGVDGADKYAHRVAVHNQTVR